MKHTSLAAPVLLIVFALALPAGATGLPDDPHPFSTGPMPPAPTTTTCHSIGACTMTNGFEAFHNDHANGVTVWAVERGSGDVDYWQCIEAGQYSGDPSHHGTQGSTDGGWIHAPSSPYLGDLEWRSGTYDYQWYDGCWAPCTLPVDPNCILLTPFKEDEPEQT